MAKMYPPRFPYPKDGGRRAEKQFYEACQNQLDDTWTVLYDVAWHGKRGKRVERGDADFVMMNESFGLFTIEVKGGEKIEVEKGQWYSTPNWSNERVTIKDPFRQVGDSKSVLFNYIKEHAPQVKLQGPFGHLVAFPGHIQEGPMGPNGPRELICDRRDILHLVETLENARRYLKINSQFSDGDIIAIKEKLMLSFALVGPQFFDLKDAVDELERLTEVQLRTFSMLRSESELTVIGGAGTGKTVLAFHKARELANQGLRTLFVCSSDSLANYLIVQLAEDLSNVKTHLYITSHGNFSRWMLYQQFVAKNLGAAAAEKLTRNVKEWPLADDFMRLPLEDLYDLVLQLKITLGAADALIIDEAQLMQAELYDLFIALMNEPKFIFIFGDRQQDWINRKAHLNTSGESLLEKYGSEEPIELMINCRSTNEIVDFSNEFVQKGSNPIGTSGAPVRIEVCESEDWVKLTAAVIHEWVNKYGLDITDITLLVEPDRMYEGIWRNSDVVNQFEANENGLTLHDGFAIDWWSGPHRFYSRSDVNVLTVGKPRITSRVYGVDRENQITNSFESWDAISKSIDQEVFWKHVDKHDRLVEACSYPVVTAKTIRDFQGLESTAVIVVNPVASQDKFLEEMYAMSTRAKALLAVVVNSETALLLNDVGVVSGFT